MAEGRIETPSLALGWSEAPWDRAVTGYPVWQLDFIEVRGADPDEPMREFVAARDRAGVGLICCRLPHDRLAESMFLEHHGFRFIEMLYRPELVLEPAWADRADPALTVRPALAADLNPVLEIAGRAFSHERFHIDPRLGPALGNLRYRQWANSSFCHPDQRPYLVIERNLIVAFFIIELLADNVCYWHLTALAPACQHRGHGAAVARLMIGQAVRMGATKIQTSITARNVAAVNLYSRLRFYFPPPMMSFHWMAPIPGPPGVVRASPV